MVGIFSKDVVFFEHFNLLAHVLVLVLNGNLHLCSEEVNYVVGVHHARYVFLLVDDVRLKVEALVDHIVNEHAFVGTFVVSEGQVPPQYLSLHRLLS